MENDFNLYKIIIRAVEDQIANNYPPATKETYNRLLSEGHNEETAKEMIASIIAEEIYYIMKDDVKIDEEMFSKKLSML